MQQQRFDANLGIEATQLGETAVHHILDTRNGDTGLSNVGGQNDFTRASRSRVKDLLLL